MRRTFIPAACGAALFAMGAALLPAAAAASEHHGNSYIFTQVYIQPGDTVNGDLNLVVGDAEVAGIVTGDCNVVFGTCTRVDGGEIMGNIHEFGGDGVRAIVPQSLSGPWGAPSGNGERGLRLSVRLLSNIIVVLVFLLFPVRTRIALDRVERHPVLSAVSGVIVGVALLPLAVLLCVSLIGIPLIALEIAGTLAGVWIGAGAIALLVGRRVCELVVPHRTPAPLPALLVGLLVVSSAEVVPIFGWAITALVWLVGFGATVLTFIRASGTQPIPARLGGPPPGGPPMRDLR